MRVGEAKRIYGKTLDVYLCILTSESSMGVREIWRALNFSSPSLAQYHVNKLLGLEPDRAKSFVLAIKGVSQKTVYSFSGYQSNCLRIR